MEETKRCVQAYRGIPYPLRFCDTLRDDVASGLLGHSYTYEGAVPQAAPPGNGPKEGR